MIEEKIMTTTVYIVVAGGIAEMRYDGSDILRPGDTLRIEVRDFDIESAREDEQTDTDDYGNPYITCDVATFRVDA